MLGTFVCYMRRATACLPSKLLVVRSHKHQVVHLPQCNMVWEMYETWPYLTINKYPNCCTECALRSNRTILQDAHTCLLVFLQRRQASRCCACILQKTHRCNVQGLHKCHYLLGNRRWHQQWCLPSCHVTPPPSLVASHQVP